MKNTLNIILALMILISCSTSGPRSVEDFNFDWKFTLGDYSEYASPDFDDSGWRELHLPHDWAIEGEFSKDNPSGPNGGALPGGIGWYRKEFQTPEAEKVFIEFDGIYMNSTVYVNGQELGTRPQGYISFTYDLTSVLNPVGENNVIAVRVDNSKQPSGRWYTGCGIYRDVRLVTTSTEHFVYGGTFVYTPEVTKEMAKVKIESEINVPEGAEYEVVNTIFDANGKVVAEGGEDLQIKSPVFWDLDDPHLYKLQSELKIGGKTTDIYCTNFGVRTFRWDVEEGFFLNGKWTKILGVCMHNDLGCVGSATYRRALERQVEILKEMGVNAIRTAHNMPDPKLLDICDKEGILVFNEAFDSWRRPKARYDYNGQFDEWHERDLTDFVRRDRNHACVFLWSIGNEIPEQSGRTPEERAANEELTRHLADIVKRNDPTRAVSAGTNGVDFDNCLMTSGGLDVIGLNYRDWGYDSLRRWHPETPIIASETASAMNSRGIYYQPSTELRVLPRWTFFSKGPKPENVNNDEPVFHQCTAYDACRAFWDVATTHTHAWLAVRDRTDVAGTFVWTGFDYLGEPTAFGWPSRSSYFGIVDLAGFPKDVYYMYQSEWTDKEVLHLHPHWNWNEGDKIDMWAYYNNADEVELFLNGKSLGRSKREPGRVHAFWPEVTFEPGVIEAVSYKDGKEVARSTRETVGEAESLRLEADRSTIAADGYDLSFITVTLRDKEGREVPTADNMLKFSVSGDGELFGIDNGNAADTLSLRGNQKQLFSGKALAVVRSIKDQKGTAILTVTDGTRTASIDIKTK